MAGKRGVPKEKFVEMGKKTQFKPGAANVNAGGANEVKPYSLRRELQYIASQVIKKSKSVDAIVKELYALMDDPATKHAGVARTFAILMFIKAAKSGDNVQIERIIENIEGKLTQEIHIPSHQPIPETAPDPVKAAAVYSEVMKG